MKKFLFFCGLVVFITVLLTMPAAAMCDECVNSEDQVTEKHCEGICTCYYEECWACGENSNLVYCGFEHEPKQTYTLPSCNEGVSSVNAVCKMCGETFAYFLVPEPHQYVSFSTSATCILQGRSGRKCSACGTEKNVTTSPALGHDYKLKQVSASCDTDGYNYQECSRCNDSYRTTTIPATGHTWKETSRDPATCQQVGKIYLECSSCGETSADTIDQLDHNYQGGKCTECGASDPDYVPPCSHNYQSSVTPPTCTDGGYTTHTCSKCGDTYTSDQTNPTGHSYQSGKCTECGASDPDYVPPCSHNYQSSVTPPTCTGGGYTTHTCSKCGDTYTSTPTNPTGHSYEDGECTECGASDPDYVPTCNHNYTSVVIPPICTANGYTTYTCTKCGNSYISDYTYTNEHVFQNGKCIHCNVSADTDECTHDYGSAITPPTCHSKGFTTFTCKKCGDAYVDNYEDEIPHQFVQQEKVEPKCGVEGHIYSVCNYNCGEVKYEPIAALKHDWQLIGTEVFEDGTANVTFKCSYCHAEKTEVVESAPSQIQNWLLTAIRGFSGALIDMYETLADGISVAGISVREVISSAIIVTVFLFLLGIALKRR